MFLNFRQQIQTLLSDLKPVFTIMFFPSKNPKQLVKETAISRNLEKEILHGNFEQ